MPVSKDRLRHAAESLTSHKEQSRVRQVVADVADEASIAALFAGEARVDHVFITAGELRPGAADLLTADAGSLRSILEVRLLGVAHVVRHARPRMQGGSFTLMSGLYAARPHAGGAMAAAAVAAVQGMTRALALDLAPVRVNAVAPGLIDTPLWNTFGPQREAILASTSKLPVGSDGRFWGLTPLYFRSVQALRDISPFEFLAHRIVWCAVLLRQACLRGLQQSIQGARKPTGGLSCVPGQLPQLTQ